MLARDGGTPVFSDPFPMWPAFSEETLEHAIDPLRNGRVNYWTGDVGTRFEEAWARWNGTRYAISTTNGTSALHTAVSSLEIGPGDEVICPSYSFIASAFCILQAGALPVFVDVTVDHTIDPTAIESAITKKTRGIIVVHLYGVVADMDPIMEIARRHQLVVIEDCAECFGGTYKGKKVGTIGNAGCFSFCQSKHFTTGGEGGMVVTDDEELAWECRSFRDHGYDVRERLRLLEMEAKLMYIHRRVGFNYRMTEMQSQIGLTELGRFDEWNLPRRRQNGRMLIEGLQNHPAVLHVPLDTPERENSYWWAPFVIDVDRLGCDTVEFVAAMEVEGVPAYRVLWPEMYLEQAFVEQKGFGTRNYPFNDPAARQIDYGAIVCDTARWLSARTISMFTHPVYEERHMRAYIDAFAKVADFYLS